MLIVFVQGGDVVVDILWFVAVHTTHTVLNDHRNFIHERWVIAHAIRDGASQNMAMTVFVLQTFTVQCGTARGRAQQEATCLLVASSPGHVTDTLETEHRVVDVERDHRAIVSAVRSRRR